MDMPTYSDAVGMLENKPKDAIVVTYSELDSYRQCPQKHEWSYHQKWREPSKEGTALARGSLWHAVMEAHYTLVSLYREDLAELEPERMQQIMLQFMLQHFLTNEAGNQSEDQQLIEWMYTGYLECYSLDDDWEPLLIENAGEVRFRYPNGRVTNFFYRFKIDLVVRQRSTGHIWLVDHKTASMFSKNAEIELDDQFRLYVWALRKSGVPVHGVVRSDSRTKRNKTPMTMEQRFRRVTTFCSDLEAQNAADYALRAARTAYNRTLPVYTSPAPDRCSWRCSYREPCIAMRKGLGTAEQLLRDFGFEQVDAKHQEYAEEPVVQALRAGRLTLDIN